MIKHLRYLFIGFCMGSADVVPGVSGGTMALILGIYEKLVGAIKTCANRKTIKDILAGKWIKVWNDISGNFLIAVGLGIALAVLSLSHALEKALASHPAAVWSLFFGLVFGSVFLVGKRVHTWNFEKIIALIVATGLAYALVGIAPVSTPETWWFLVLCGAIAICAMILPGISGSFLLVLFGKYEFILNAVNQRDILSIAYVGIGAIVGILSFSHILNWCLKKHHDLMIATLTGLMLGSIRRIWPWKAQSGVLTSDNVLPHMNTNTYVLIGVMIIGVFLVVLLDHFGKAVEK